MVRKMAGYLIVGVWTGLLFAAIGVPPATSADSDPVIAGTFTMKVHPEPGTGRDDFKVEPGNRTYFFGAGCTVGSACKISRTNANGETVPQELGASGGRIVWESTQALDCIDPETGQVRTPHGADYSITTRLMPSATTVRDGVTYVTAMRGTSDAVQRVNAAGRADNCTIPPNGALVERAHAVLTGTVVPLAAPRPAPLTPPLGVDPSTAQEKAGATGTMPAFELPQTDRQQASAEAVADGRRSSVPGALVTPAEAFRNIGDRLPEGLLLVALLGLLMIFPAQLFNSTYEENHERIDKQLARLRLRRRHAPVIPAQPMPPDVSPPPQVAASEAPPRGRRVAIFLGCAVVGTLLGGLLDPKFGPNRASYALAIGLFLSMLLAVLVGAFTGRTFRSVTHSGHSWYLRAIPSALLIAVVCVVVSRLTHFEPGYLYGVLGGAVFAAALDRRSEGRAEVAVTATMLVLAVLAWVAFAPVARAADGADPAFWLLSTDAFLGSLFIGGIEGLLFGLIPLRFLPGYRIRGWNWVAWGALTGVVLFAFVHVLLLPEAGYLGRSTVASVRVTMALFLAFGLASGLFWLWFRLRPTQVDLEQEVPAAEGAAEPIGPDDSAVGTSRPGATRQVRVPATGGAGDPPQVPAQTRPVDEDQL